MIIHSGTDNDRVSVHLAMQAFPQENISHYTTACTTFPYSLVEVYSVTLNIEVYVMDSCYCIMMFCYIMHCFIFTLWLFTIALRVYSVLVICVVLHTIFQFAAYRCCCATHRCVWLLIATKWPKVGKFDIIFIFLYSLFVHIRRLR